LDKDLFIQEANDSFLAYFKVSKEDLKGRQLEHSSLAPHFTEEHFSTLKQALEGSGSVTETHIEGVDEDRYFRMKFIPLVFEAGGRAVGIIFEDITEMKRYQQELEQRVMERTTELVKSNDALEKRIREHLRAQDALKESETKYRRIVETANEGIWVMDAEMRTTFVNQRLADMLGYTIEELLGHPFTDTMDPDQLEDHNQKVSERRKGISDKYERKFRTRDDRVIWCLISTTPVMDTKGTFQGSFAMVTDITERKYVEEQITLKNIILSTQMETSLDGILIVDERGRILNCNQKFIEIWGIPRDLITSRIDETVLQYVEGQVVDPEAFISHVRYLYDHKDEKSFEEIFLMDGRILERFSAPMLGENRKYYGRVWYFRDISERKQTEDAIKKANKQVSLLTSITRHDILNQLTMLEGYISHMKEQSINDAFADLIKKEENIAKTIHSQIVFTRIYQNVGVQPPQWKNVKDSISSVLATANVGDVSVVLNTGTLEIYADLLIEKVFFNLIENALRHGEHVTRIHVSYQQTEKGVILAIEDDGIGIPEQEKDQIFTRGFGKHTGYGLFLAREILAITGITIRETGESGKGARFEMMVPEAAYRFADIH
jgi:PAS domain S-box-containing protein